MLTITLVDAVRTVLGLEAPVAVAANDTAVPVAKARKSQPSPFRFVPAARSSRLFHAV